jgi:galactokinase
MLPDPGATKAQFINRFGGGGRIHLIRAPGRVNLIGEHTDYNDGFVLPMAIEPQVMVACRGRDDGAVRLSSTQFPSDLVEFSVNQKVSPAEPKWANYMRGVAAEMLAAGIPLVGMDALYANTLPAGAGLSSSAAIEVATAQALLTLAGLKMDASRIALLSQKAEHDFANVPVGIMDMTVVASAKAGHAMFLDCRDLSKQFVPIDARDLRIVIVNSMLRHELSGGEYATRRNECEAGFEFFRNENPAVSALRDVSTSQIESAEGRLDPMILRRCRHVVTENTRTSEAAAALGKRHYEIVGELMLKSHQSLRDDYEVSAAELDFLVDEAMKLKGVYGSRMTGGGFGGCTVSLVQPRAVDAIVDQIKKQYQDRFNLIPDVFVTDAAAGASVVE